MKKTIMINGEEKRVEDYTVNYDTVGIFLEGNTLIEYKTVGDTEKMLELGLEYDLIKEYSSAYRTFGSVEVADRNKAKSQEIKKELHKLYEEALEESVKYEPTRIYYDFER